MVIMPQPIPFDNAGTLSSQLSITCNPATPGLLKVVVYGTTPMNGMGTLLNLKFNAVGTAGNTSPLTLQNFMFNEGIPQNVTTNGLVIISSPTAASGSIAGRVTDLSGSVLPYALVTLTTSTGETSTRLTNAKGKFLFKELPTGETYIVTVAAKRHTFTPQVVSVINDLTELNFTAEQ